MAGWERPPLVPAALIVGVVIAAAWRLRRYRVALEHASQAARLTAFFVALAVPSIVVYPSLVDAHGRAHRQLVETRYAPEVVNQRRNLQLRLNEALGQIESITDLGDLISAGEPALDGPPSTDAAFHVWERTVLKNQRSTAVELHDAAGALVSRFALELPLAGGPQTYKAVDLPVGDLRGGLAVLRRRAAAAPRGEGALPSRIATVARRCRIDRRARHARLQQSVVRLGAEPVRRPAARSAHERAGGRRPRRHRVHRLRLEPASALTCRDDPRGR